MKTEEKIIMYDSPEAAQRKTVTGWVSSGGFFYGEDERIARYAGCTHQPCEGCGKPTKKSWSRCTECQIKRDKERYAALKREPWDGDSPLALFDTDTYFFSIEEAEDYAEEHDCKLEDLMLVICNPVFPSEIEPNEHFCDELPEDGDVEDADILEAFEKLNEAIRKAKPFSWGPGDTAPIFKKA